jgi:7-cyano-7-deazaguanine synthase
MKVIVLLSGGMDSVTALYQAAASYTVAGTVSFDYGSKHNRQELNYARWHAEHLKLPSHVIDLPFVNDLFQSDLLRSGGEIPDGHYEDASMQQTVVPFRNGIMLSIAAGLAESLAAEGVVIGAHSGDHAIYPDCREVFIEAMGRAIQLGTYAELSLISPFISMSKAEIVAVGQKLNVDYGKTWSCYKGLEQHCGTCGTCVERREAFALAGVNDPTVYASEPEVPTANKPVRQ